MLPDRARARIVAFLEQRESYRGIFRPRAESQAANVYVFSKGLGESPCFMLLTCFTGHSCDPFADRG